MVSVILKKIYIIFIYDYWHCNLRQCYVEMLVLVLVLFILRFIFVHIYLHCYKMSEGYSSNISNNKDFVKIAEITSTQHYIKLAYNRFIEQKMFGNDRMETISTIVLSLSRPSSIENSTWRTHQYFVNFESRIHDKIFTSNRCHNFHLD